jgi:hypothetical protein
VGAPAGGAADDEETAVGFVEEADIATAGAVAALAAAAGERSGVWWRELQPLLVAYSGAAPRRSYAEGVRFPHFFPQTMTFPQFSPKFLDPYGHTWTQRKEGGQPQKPSSDVV